jgi:hypothetical protein
VNDDTQKHNNLFQFETFDDDLILEKMLEIRVIEAQTGKYMGFQRIDASPLLLSPRIMSEWQPIYHTEHGIQGEILTSVEVHHLRSLTQKFGSAITFFLGEVPTATHRLDREIGLIEELVEAKRNLLQKDH